MLILELVVILIVSVTFSNIISHFVPEVPISLFGSSLGCFIALLG